jgi:hypothetical protein
MSWQETHSYIGTSGSEAGPVTLYPIKPFLMTRRVIIPVRNKMHGDGWFRLGFAMFKAIVAFHFM